MHSVAAERDANVNPFRFTPGQIKKSRILPLIGLLCGVAMCACDRRGAGQTSHCCLPSSPPPFDLSISPLCNPPLPSSILSSPPTAFLLFPSSFSLRVVSFCRRAARQTGWHTLSFFRPILFSISPPQTRDSNLPSLLFFLHSSSLGRANQPPCFPRRSRG